MKPRPGKRTGENMRFIDKSEPITVSELNAAEKDAGIKLPSPVKTMYLLVNGGSPEPYVFENDEVDTVVAEFLPIVSQTIGTSLESYAILVKEKKIVARNFFPFAVDGSGDYFFVDCSTDDGQVYFFRGDSRSPGLISLSLGFEAFWKSLKEE